MVHIRARATKGDGPERALFDLQHAAGNSKLSKHPLDRRFGGRKTLNWIKV